MNRDEDKSASTGDLGASPLADLSDDSDREPPKRKLVPVCGVMCFNFDLDITCIAVYVMYDGIAEKTITTSFVCFPRSSPRLV